MFWCKFLQTVLPPLSKQEHTLLTWFYKVVDYLYNSFFLLGKGEVPDVVYAIQNELKIDCSKFYRFFERLHFV